MAKKWEEFKENVTDKVDEVIEAHPTATVGAGYLLGAVLFIPLCVGLYKVFGRAEGKAIAEGLLEAGVNLGYSHD